MWTIKPDPNPGDEPDDWEWEDFEYPEVPTVEYCEPDVLVLYGPNGEAISMIEDRPFPFGFCSSEV